MIRWGINCGAHAQAPADFWRELREAGLVHPEAPLPIDD